MILRKPYAFLIKYFRLIHLTLILPLIYLLVKTTKIVSFFNDYANQGTFKYVNNLAGSYINVLMYVSIIFVLLIVLVITYLLVVKKKTIKLYVGVIIYYLLLLVIITMAHGVLSSIEVDILKVSTIRAYRDVAILFYVPQYFFLGYMIVRAIGFDIKKFNFSTDLKELQISAEDNEEFEFSISGDNYRQKRKIKRSVREFKYYLIENKFVISCIVLTLILAGGIYIYYHNFVYHKRYNETQIISNNGFQLKVNQSLITDLDYKGNYIVKNKYYLAISMNITNRLGIDKKVEKKDFCLVIDNNRYYPIYDRGDFFLDYGIPYKGTELKPNIENTYVVVYEIPKEAIYKSASLMITNQIDITNGELSARYKYIKINPTVVLNVNKITEVNMNNKIEFDSDIINGGSLKVTDAVISDEYAYTINGVTKHVTINTAKYGFNKIIVALKDNFKVDKDNYYSDVINKFMFYSNHASINYETSGNKLYFEPVINITPNDLKDVTLLQVNKKILNGNSIKLVITLRDKSYYIKLK